MVNTPRLVVADLPAGVQTLRNILGQDVSIVAADTLDAALMALRQGAELGICGIHFDDSRMFDLVRAAKEDPATREIPLLCFRDLDSELAPTLLQSLEIACKVLGAVGFIDLHQVKQRQGLARADAYFRAVIQACLLGRTEI